MKETNKTKMVHLMDPKTGAKWDMTFAAKNHTEIAREIARHYGSGNYRYQYWLEDAMGFYRFHYEVSVWRGKVYYRELFTTIAGTTAKKDLSVMDYEMFIEKEEENA